MLKSDRNQLSGRFSPGFRFRFHVRSIAHNRLYLPLTMKQLPEIRQLMQGVSPLVVFNRCSIQSARQAFYELRKKHDFAYWAATEYYIHDINDADSIVPLILNSYQHHIIDTFERRYFNRQRAAYVISKAFRKCGVTTCVQAYILWRQTYHLSKHSNTCTASAINTEPLKTNLCRFLKREIVPQDNHIFLPNADCRAFFNTYRTPDALRGIDFAYVHLANMSQWGDSEGRISPRVFAASTGGVLMSHQTLIVLEGNIPDKVYMIDAPRHYDTLKHCRPSDLSHLSRNPYFLIQHIAASNPNNDQPRYFHPINLSLHNRRFIYPPSS